MTRPRRRIFVECSYTYFAGGTGGIRRVSRNLANIGMASRYEDADIRPLVWAGIGFVMPRRALSDKPHPFMRTFRLVRDHAQRGANFLANLEPVRVVLAPVARLLRKGRRHLPGGEWVYLVHGLFAFPFGFRSAIPVRFQPGDIVVLVDSTWNSQKMLRALFTAQRMHQIRVGAMLHDLFPLTIPHMCHADSVSGYTQWFTTLAPHADFFITNSNATLQELHAYLGKTPQLAIKPLRAGSFPLGGSIPGAAASRSTDSVAAFAPLSGFVLLAVGTIEPRKNYQCILDAFDLLLARGLDASLVIVGHRGWKCDDVLARLETHPLRGTRLIHLDHADDEMLACAYRRAHCLVSASWNEGFGLPVVEGLMYGLHVLASDIPAYREIASPACSYFRADSPDDLARCVAEIALKANDPDAAPDERRPTAWIDWTNSTLQFKNRVLQLADIPIEIHSSASDDTLRSSHS